MKIYYKGECYPLIWKTQMRKDLWYSMEPARLKITMPRSIYDYISSEVNRTNNRMDDSGLYELKFEVHKSESDIVKWGVSDKKTGLWEIEALVYSCIMSSEFTDGTVIGIFDVGVMEVKVQDKSRLRDYLLNEIVQYI